MKTIFFSLILCLGFSLNAGASESKLVNVDKNSKLSDYFKKINTKVSDDSEEKSLDSIGRSKSSAKDDLMEEEILLAEASTKSKNSSKMSPVNKMVISLVGLLLMVALFFSYVVKAGKKKGYTQIAQNIKVLTQKSIGPKKNLMLIRVAGETILLGVTDQNINHIKTLSLMEDELPQFTEPKFASQLEEKIEKTKEEPSLVSKEPEEVDGFSISNINDVKQAVSRYQV